MRPNFGSSVVAGVLILALATHAQANKPSNTDQKPGAQAAGGIEILSDTMGVDLRPYLSAVQRAVRDHWYNLVPEVAKPPIMKKGNVAIEFTIQTDGSVGGMKLVNSSKDMGLDRAALGGITASSPFPPLPADFKGQFLALRFTFAYNPLRDEQISSSEDSFTIGSASARMAPGSTHQFTAKFQGGATGEVSWSLSGAACAKSDCGSISTAGLYTAPARAPDPPEVTVTATQTAAPFKSASTKIKIAKP